MDLDSLELFILGLGIKIGEKGKFNFCCKVKEKEDKIFLLKFIQKLVESGNSNTYFQGGRKMEPERIVLGKGEIWLLKRLIKAAAEKCSCPPKEECSLCEARRSLESQFPFLVQKTIVEH